MNLTIVKTLSKGEQSLIMDTRPRKLEGASEDALLDLHARVRRGRNKYSKLYRQGARSQVKADRSRGAASKKSRGDAQRAEVFEDALARVSDRLSKAARKSATKLRKQRLAAAKAQKAAQGQGPQGRAGEGREGEAGQGGQGGQGQGRSGQGLEVRGQGRQQGQGQDRRQQALGRLAALHQGPQEREAGPLMLVDGGIGSDLAKAAGQAQRPGGAGLRRHLGGGDQPRSVPRPHPGRRAHRAASSSARASRWRSPAAR